MSIYALIVVIIGILLILFVLIFWAISQYSNTHYYNYIKNSMNSIRSVVIDWNKQEVRFFNRSRLRYVRTIPLERYYWQFSKKDARKLNDWFIELLKKNSKVDKSAEVDVRLHRTRRYFHSLLDVTNVDYEKKMINIDSYLFLKSSRYRLKFDSQSKLKLSIGSKGYTANFAFYWYNHAGAKVPLSRLLFAQLKEVTADMISSHNKELIDTGSNQFAIVDFKITDPNAALNDIHKINNQMRKFLEINGKLERVSISIGLVYNSYYKSNARRILDKAKDMSEIASSKNTLIITYTKRMKNNLEEDKFDTEIEQVIKKKQITYNFESIYNVRRERVIGYIVLPTPKETSAETMAELYSRALKTGENQQLLNVIVKDSTAAFNSGEPRDAILFRHLRFGETENFLSLLKGASHSVNQAVIFDEYDISYSSNEDKEFINKIKKYQERKIDVCLALSDKSLILDHKIYALFDYFFVYTNDDKHKRDESTNLAIRTIIEKLMKYGKPIILANVDAWSTIELFIRSGVEYVASSAITPISTDLLDVPTKIKSRIKRMVD